MIFPFLPGLLSLGRRIYRTQLYSLDPISPFSYRFILSDVFSADYIHFCFGRTNAFLSLIFTLRQGNHRVLVSRIAPPIYSSLPLDTVTSGVYCSSGHGIRNGGFCFLRKPAAIACEVGRDQSRSADKVPPPRSRRRMNSRQPKWKPSTQQPPTPELALFLLPCP